jgi:hypothetical protein
LAIRGVREARGSLRATRNAIPPEIWLATGNPLVGTEVSIVEWKRYSCLFTWKLATLVRRRRDDFRAMSAPLLVGGCKETDALRNQKWISN